MPGINQLPAGGEGAAAFALIYSIVSWTCSAVFICVARIHHEGWSYIALLLYFALMSTTASIIQQIRDITIYQDMRIEQYNRGRTRPNDPELAIANQSYGMDLVLYYIQYYSYSVEAMLVMFWAFELAQSVYGLSAKAKWKPVLRKINIAGKAIAVFFPLLTILLLRIPAIQNIFILFILIADLPLMVSLAIGSLTMVAILIRYVQSRKEFSNWTPPGASGATDESADTMQSSQTGGTRRSKLLKRRGLYDRWLMVRFTVAFVVLAIFEVTNTLFQVQSINNNKLDSQLASPDLSVGRSVQTSLLFLPGVTPGIFIFIVFGTTSGCRTSMKDFFLPKRWRSNGSTRRCNFWLPWRKRLALGDAESTTENPFRDAYDTQSNFTRRSDFSRRSDTMKALPIVPPVSKYNKNFNSSHDAAANSSSQPGSRQSRTEMPVEEEIESIQLRNITSLDQIREEYYTPSPDLSDDSGPVLPIMTEPERRLSRGRVAVAVSLQNGRIVRHSAQS